MDSPTMGKQICSLDPPDLSSIVRNNEVIHPSKEQEDIAVEKSRGYWYHIASTAYAYLANGLAPAFTSPQLSLHKVPKFPSHLKSSKVHTLGMTEIFALCSTASSTWRLTEPPEYACDSLKKERTNHAFVQVGTASTISYKFHGEVFSQWVGVTTETSTGPNYLGILAIGWCYVLSAQLLEMQGDSAVMRYTNYFADCLGESPSSQPEGAYFIDIGETDERVVRWWSAILAKHEGWKAIVKNKKGHEFVAPWSGSRACETLFIIKRNCDLSLEQAPLSSDDAFDAILQFALLHNLGSQFHIALTIAMSFPMHRYYGTDVKLPLPRAHGGKTLATIPSTSIWKQVKQDLPYYMTLSCSPELMISTLCGSFWQPDVPCNMVSQWLHPVLEEVLYNATESKCQELVAIIGAIRRPNIGALWIGAAASGISPQLLGMVKEGMPPLDSNAFPWTGALQSFMDLAGSGPYTWSHPEYISRPDVWRLLNLSPTEEDDLGYRYGPMTPWEPCGVCLTKDCALRITSHLKCPRHEYRYDHWSWELDNGETLHDCGFSEKEFPSLLTADLPDILCIQVHSQFFEKKQLDPDREASEEASLETFRWFMMGGEAIPPEKLYHDDLLYQMWEQILEDDQGGNEPVQDRDSQLEERALKDKDQFEAWLDNIP